MAKDKKILLLTEGETDIKIVRAILEAAKFPIAQIEFEAANGWQNAFKIAKTKTHNFDKVIVLVDADEPTIPDAKLHWQKRLLNQDVEVVFAIPEIESWIFADEDLLRKKRNGHASKTLDRLPLPEEIPHPKQLASYWFKNNSDWSFLAGMNIEKAVAKTPSLRDFLIKMGEALEIDTEHLQKIVTTNLNRKVFANLLKEVASSDTIMYRTMDGHQYTAQQMWESIEAGQELGTQYASDLLRIARDFLKRQATR